MKALFSLFNPQQKLLEQERELNSLRQQVELLTQQNNSMKTGMRRCTSCEYRIDYKNRQKEPLKQSIITTQ